MGRDDRNINLKVRREVLLQVLIWLKHKNKLYESINIDMNHVEQLPKEGYLGETSASISTGEPNRAYGCEVEEDQ